MVDGIITGIFKVAILPISAPAMGIEYSRSASRVLKLDFACWHGRRNVTESGTLAFGRGKRAEQP
jgi:hypothetical protein